jgi:hypothetical protein
VTAAPPASPAPRRTAAGTVALLLLAGALRAPAAGAAQSEETPARLAGRLLGDTPVEADLRYLCDRIGGRPTGSAACERSVDWFIGRFQKAGVDRAWTEAFPMPRSWEEDRTRGRAVSPETIPLGVAGMPFSPPTPKGGLEAPLIPVGPGSPEDFQRAGERARGALVLVGSDVLVTFEDLFDEYVRVAEIMPRARAAGAAGLLLIASRERDLLYRHVATFGTVAPYPMAVVAREEGLRLARLAAEGAVRVRLDVAARLGPAFESRNVLAEIRGRERPEEIVLAGAHLDSWDLGTGALDNGANCALLLDVARQMAALGERPRRTVRFALFTGEEQGMFGSLGYVRTHRSEMARHAAVVVIDTGTGRVTGFSLGGREDLRPLVETALRPAAGHGAAGHTADAFVGTDNFDFLLEGVPNLVANQAPANYMESYHASSDTFDKVDGRELRLNGALVATVLWGLAESPDRAPRQDRPAVAALLQRTGLESQMKTFGIWAQWETGARGRAEE